MQKSRWKAKAHDIKNRPQADKASSGDEWQRRAQQGAHMEPGPKHTPRATAPASTPSPRRQAQPQGSSASSPGAHQQDQMREDTSRQDTRCPTILTNRRLSSRETCTRTLRGSTRRLPPASRSPAGGEARTSRCEQRYLGRGRVQGPPCSLHTCTRLKCPTGLDLQSYTSTDTREPRSRGMQEQGTRTWESVHGKPLGTRMFKHTHWGLSPRPRPAHHQESHPGLTVGSRLCDLF